MNGDFIDVYGQTTFVIDQGSGPVVVLLHGASLAIDATSTWKPLIRVLSQHCRVIAFDQIGFGRSDMPCSNQYLNRMQRVDHAIALLDLLHIDEAVLVGHSEGGFMAARMAIVRPQLARKLVVAASGGLAPRIGGERDRDWVQASRLAYTYGIEAETEDGFLALSRRLTAKANQDLELLLLENYRRPNTPQQLEMFRSIERSTNYPDDYLSLQENHIFPYAAALPPTLLIWGADDQTVPVERAVLLAGRLPNADLHVFSGAAHMVMYDRQAAFNQLVLQWCNAGCFV